MTEIGNNLEKAARIIREGGVVAFPTETSYGLGASIHNLEAIQRIYLIKDRSEEKTLLVLIGDLEDIPKVAKEVPESSKALMERFWPGPLTILLPAKEGLDQRLKNPKGQVAVRLTSHPLARRLIRAVGTPITGTSANRSGEPAAKDPEEILKGLSCKYLAYILDGGALPPSAPSTIVDPSFEPPLILREGGLSKEDILSSHWKGPS